MSRTVPTAAYAVLDVSPGDDFATIRAAWRRAVKAHHPDLAQGGRAAATRRLVRINAAWDALCRHRQADAEAQSARAASDAAATAAGRARRAGRAAAEAARAAAEAELEAHAEELRRAEARRAAERTRRADDARAATREISTRYAAARAAYDAAMRTERGTITDLCA